MIKKKAGRIFSHTAFFISKLDYLLAIQVFQSLPNHDFTSPSWIRFIEFGSSPPIGFGLNS